jgi:hypothetical protein
MQAAGGLPFGLARTSRALVHHSADTIQKFGGRPRHIFSTSPLRESVTNDGPSWSHREKFVPVFGAN